MTGSNVAVFAFECPLRRARAPGCDWKSCSDVPAFTSARRDSIDHRSALLSLFDIVDTASRDLKTDLLQELDRQRSLWSTQLDNPEGRARRWRSFAADMDAVIHDLHGQIGKINQHLRESEGCRSCGNARNEPRWRLFVRYRCCTAGCSGVSLSGVTP